MPDVNDINFVISKDIAACVRENNIIRQTCIVKLSLNMARHITIVHVRTQVNASCTTALGIYADTSALSSCSLDPYQSVTILKTVARAAKNGNVICIEINTGSPRE